MDPDEAKKQVDLIILVIKIGFEVFVDVLNILYCCEKPIEKNLKNFAEIKSNKFNRIQKYFLIRLAKGKEDIKQMDISLSFKLIQLTCGLEDKNSCVWRKKCPKKEQNCLEHLLSKFRDKRNLIFHQNASIGGISEEEFIKRKRELIDNLIDIVKKVGEKAQLSTDDIKSWIDRIELDSRTFCGQVTINPPSSMEKSMSRPSTGKDVVELQVSLPDEQSRNRRVAQGLFEDLRVPQSKLNISLNLTGALRKAFDLTNEDKSRTTFNKSNRLYWVDRLISTQALYNSEQNSIFWKEYEKYLE